MSSVPRTGRKFGLGTWSPDESPPTGMQTQAAENEHNNRVTRHTLVNERASVVSRLGARRRRANANAGTARVWTRDMFQLSVSLDVVRTRWCVYGSSCGLMRRDGVLSASRPSWPRKEALEVVQVVEECPSAALWLWVRLCGLCAVGTATSGDESARSGVRNHSECRPRRRLDARREDNILQSSAHV
ncbi:hypothetical protein EXIGLDRAFT_520409 [Exidia glandulosa HHB12029]|uniref:Uncharacterized protein n=1 Tax=Exidia glandulosa HHB12029 TaxID=1314781 RepID=A0A166N0Z1_EXIGL|nr:hypothetical protein EXIGLDRAFT_520409 [Exidia glandulosa HHB12029]